MKRSTRPVDQPVQSTRRGMLKHTAGAAVLGMTVLGGKLPAQDSKRAERAVKNGRIKQSIVYWCFEQYWDMEQAAKVATQLGCESIELMAPKHFPVLKEHGLKCAIGTVDMSPDPPFVKGFNNPKYRDKVLHATREAIDVCADFGTKNVICFTGHARGHSRRRGCTELRRRLQTDRRSCREEGGHALSGDAQLARQFAPDEGASRLPGRPHRILHRYHQAGRLAQSEAALRHLSRPDHGRRHHHAGSSSTMT